MKNKKTTPGVHAWITSITNDPDSPKKATASIQIGNLLYVRGISIYSSGESLYITMPKHTDTNSDGNQILTQSVESGSHEMRKAIHDAVIEAYNTALARFESDTSPGPDLPFTL